MPDSTNAHGKVLASWTFPEYIRHHYSRTWYIAAGIIVGGSFLLSILKANILFAVFILMIVALYVIRNRRPPVDIRLNITEDGLEVENTFYSYDRMKAFWVVYQPPEVKRLYIGFKNTLSTNLSIPLQDQNPVRIREFLLRYVTEDLEQQNESFSDAVQRLLKL